MRKQRSRFAVLIRQQRRRLEITQTELAESLGLRQPSVSAWEQGVSFPATQLVAPLAARLGLDPGELLMAMGEDADRVPA